MKTNTPFATTFRKGDLVRYSKPEAGEESFRFVVIEDNGNRVVIEDTDSAVALPGQETVEPSELVLVQSLEASK